MVQTQPHHRAPQQLLAHSKRELLTTLIDGLISEVQILEGTLLSHGDEAKGIKCLTAGLRIDRALSEIDKAIPHHQTFEQVRSSLQLFRQVLDSGLSGRASDESGVRLLPGAIQHLRNGLAELASIQ